MAPPRKIRVVCTVEGCEALSKYGDLCGKHYKRFWRHGANITKIDSEPDEFCWVEGCASPPKALGVCQMHYARIKRHGHEGLTRRANGTGGKDANGYMLVTVNGKRRYEHIVIAEIALGKPLPEGAVVHHVTENKADNFGPFKLVICPDQAYHLLIHRLMKEKGISFKEGWPN